MRSSKRSAGQCAVDLGLNIGVLTCPSREGRGTVGLRGIGVLEAGRCGTDQTWENKIVFIEGAILLL